MNRRYRTETDRINLKLFRHDKIIAATVLIEDVLKTLDESEKPCRSCHMNIKNDWEEAKAAKWLRGLIPKLRQVNIDLNP
jgi:hypothetical protein